MSINANSYSASYLVKRGNVMSLKRGDLSEPFNLLGFHKNCAVVEIIGDMDANDGANCENPPHVCITTPGPHVLHAVLKPDRATALQRLDRKPLRKAVKHNARPSGVPAHLKTAEGGAQTKASVNSGLSDHMCHAGDKPKIPGPIQRKTCANTKQDKIPKARPCNLADKYNSLALLVNETEGGLVEVASEPQDQPSEAKVVDTNREKYEENVRVLNIINKVVATKRFEEFVTDKTRYVSDYQPGPPVSAEGSVKQRSKRRDSTQELKLYIKPQGKGEGVKTSNGQVELGGRVSSAHSVLKVVSAKERVAKPQTDAEVEAKLKHQRGDEPKISKKTQQLNVHVNTDQIIDKPPESSTRTDDTSKATDNQSSASEVKVSAENLMPARTVPPNVSVVVPTSSKTIELPKNISILKTVPANFVNLKDFPKKFYLSKESLKNPNIAKNLYVVPKNSFAEKVARSIHRNQKQTAELSDKQSPAKKTALIHPTCISAVSSCQKPVQTVTAINESQKHENFGSTNGSVVANEALNLTVPRDDPMNLSIARGAPKGTNGTLQEQEHFSATKNQRTISEIPGKQRTTLETNVPYEIAAREMVTARAKPAGEDEATRHLKSTTCETPRQQNSDTEAGNTSEPDSKRARTNADPTSVNVNDDNETKQSDSTKMTQNTTSHRKTQSKHDRRAKNSKLLSKTLLIRREVSRFMSQSMNRNLIKKKQRLKRIAEGPKRTAEEPQSIAEEAKRTAEDPKRIAEEPKSAPKVCDFACQVDFSKEVRDQSTQVSIEADQHEALEKRMMEELYESILSTEDPDLSVGCVQPELVVPLHSADRKNHLLDVSQPIIYAPNSVQYANNVGCYGQASFSQNPVMNSFAGNHSDPLMNEKLFFFDYLTKCTEVDLAGNLPIHIAVCQNNPVEVKRQCIALTIKRISIDSLNDNDMTPLQLAILNTSATLVVETLLKYGADITVIDKEGNNVLHLAILHSSVEILHELLRSARERKINMDLYNYEGFTPLILSAMENKYQMTDLMLKYGANPNLCDRKSGRTPLFHAVENNSINMVKLLIQADANTKKRNFFGTSTHDAVFELEAIKPEIRSMIIGKEIAQHKNKAGEKKRRTPRKDKNQDAKKPKLKVVTVFQKIEKVDMK